MANEEISRILAGVQRLPLLPTQDQLRILSQQMGNIRIARNRFIRVRNQVVQKGEPRLTPEQYLGNAWLLLTNSLPFLKNTDMRLLRNTLDGLDRVYRISEDGEPIPFPHAAQKTAPEGNRILARSPASSVSLIRPGFCVAEITGLGNVSLQVPPGWRKPAPAPGRSFLEICIQRREQRYFAVFVSPDMRRAVYDRWAESVLATERDTLRAARKRVLRLREMLQYKRTDPETGELSRKGQILQGKLSRAQTELQRQYILADNIRWEREAKNA